MTCPGICATAIQNKERSAERELVDYLERVNQILELYGRKLMGSGLQVADELYPTLEATVKQERDTAEDVDLEEMLKQELAGMSVNKKSTRFRQCFREPSG